MFPFRIPHLAGRSQKCRRDAGATAGRIPHAALAFAMLLTLAHAIQTPEVEIGNNGAYDGTVKIRRDSQGRLLLTDSQVTSAVSLNDLRYAGRDHGLLLGLLDDDHPQYLNAARHDTPLRHALGTVVPHDVLANLGDTAITGPAGGDLLCYDRAAAKWKNGPLANLGIEPAIATGSGAQYWRGDKTWQPLNQAAVAGLTAASRPAFAALTLTGPTSATVINATAGINTGAGAGTQRIDASGIGTLSGLTINANAWLSSYPQGGNGNILWAGGYASPDAGRAIFGDGSGWKMYLSKRNGGSTTDLFTFKDDGSLDVSGALKLAGATRLESTGKGTLSALDVSGAVRFGTSTSYGSFLTDYPIVTHVGESDTMLYGNEAQTGLVLIGTGGWWGMRQGTDHAFNIDMWNYNNKTNALKVAQSGAVTIAGNINTASGDLQTAGKTRIDSAGNATLAGVQVGPAAASPTATPARLSLGGTYSSTAGANPKLALYYDGINANEQYGLGVSLNQMEYMVPSTRSHKWFAGGVLQAALDGAGNYAIAGDLAIGSGAGKITLNGQRFMNEVNLLDNPDFNIWQRNTSQGCGAGGNAAGTITWPVPGTLTTGADRWQVSRSKTDMSTTISRATPPAPLATAQYCLKNELIGGAICNQYIHQTLPRELAAGLRGKWVTFAISHYMAGTSGGTIGIYKMAGGTPVALATYSFDSTAGAWERVAVAAQIPADAENVLVSAHSNLAAGGPTAAYLANAVLAEGKYVNTTEKVSDPALSSVPPLPRRPAEDLAACQRYYEKGSLSFTAYAPDASLNYYTTTVHFNSAKAASPGITIINLNSGALGNTVVTTNAQPAYNAGTAWPQGFQVNIGGATGGAAMVNIAADWTALCAEPN